MATPEQIERVRQRLATGENTQQIIDELRSNAWSDESITKLMAAAGASSASPTPPIPETPMPDSVVTPQPVTPTPASPPTPPSTPTPTPPSSEPTPDWRIKRGYLRTFGFGILSSLYFFWWFYVTRKQLDRERNTKSHTLLQTFGLLVPILNTVVTYWLYRDLAAARVASGLTAGVRPVLYAMITSSLTVFFVVMFLSLVLPHDIAQFVNLVLILLLLLLPLAILYIYFRVIKALNGLWDERSKGTASEASVSKGEIISLLAVVVIPFLIGIFGSLLLAVLSGTKNPEPQPPLRTPAVSEETPTPSSDPFPDNADDDGDGLNGRAELRYGSDPTKSDSDDDGYSDGDEVKGGFNPAGPGKLPAASTSAQ